MTYILIWLLASAVTCTNDMMPVEIPVIHAEQHKIILATHKEDK